jgi:hypothetical protein
MHRAEGGVEAAVEADHHRGAEARDLRPALLDLRDVERDRLLAQNCLAGLGGGGDEIDMRIGAGGDQNGVDLRVGQDLVDRGSRLDAQFGRHRVGRLGEDVEDGGETRLRVAGQVAGMHGADAAAAED